MNKEVAALEPKSVWTNFERLNEIPRPSKHEERVREFMVNFGKSLNLETLTDSIGNVLIRKPATAGMENRATLVLQSHLDMVHQKNNDTNFDFSTQGIQTLINGDWVKANGTTLGADNGMGVAAIMALLESTTIPHPELEALFTIDEETGMTGAKNLEPGFVKGKILLNLDTEEDNELTIGCAGGVDTNTNYNYSTEAVFDSAQGFLVTVKGLKGGHSGMDIHKGLGNANKLMNRLLYAMNQTEAMRIFSVDGGSLRNAIPRESNAVVVVNSSKLSTVEAAFNTVKAQILEEYKLVEPNLSISFTATETPSEMMVAADQTKILNTLYAMPNGVFRMSPEIEGLVETSSNLARVIIKNGDFITQSLQRSSVESTKQDIAQAIRATFENMGATVENDGDYPGWAPNSASAILKVMENQYRKVFNEEPHVNACHAGLECGIIGAHYAGMDMISFGPTIRNAHSPDECVSISSVQKFWKFLLQTLADAPLA